jgi:hypothetical protein
MTVRKLMFRMPLAVRAKAFQIGGDELMETVVCNNCGCPETVLLHKFRLELEHQDAFVVRCSRCGLVYLNPRPPRDRIGLYYPPNYQTNMLDLFAKVRRM